MGCEFPINCRYISSNTCMNFITSHRNNQWLRNLFTGDEKWALCINNRRWCQCLSRGQTGVATPKVDSHSKTLMLSVLWESEEQFIEIFFQSGVPITARYLLSAVVSCGTIIQRKTGSNLHSPRQCENRRGKVVARKITVADLRNRAPSTVFSILDSNRLSLFSVSLKQFARTGVRRREGPKSRHRHFLCLETCRLLWARQPFPPKSLAMSHRIPISVYTTDGWSS